MTRPRRTLWLLAALGLVLASVVWWWIERTSTHITAPIPVAASEAAEPTLPQDHVQRAPPVPPVLPVYTPQSDGLPPIDASLRESYSALKASAANGNATAACRLAFTAMDCWQHDWGRGSAETAAVQADLAYGRDDGYITSMAAQRIAEAPPALRDYIRERIDAIELARATAGDAIRARARRCEGAPMVGSGEVATLLRQAALAGQPDAVVAYANGEWMTVIMGRNAARTPDEAPPSLEIFRDPSFRVWRRDAVAVHRAGLESGLLPVIESAAMPNRMTSLDELLPWDPVRQAAAVRTLAARVGSGEPPSTASLGLDEGQSFEADRLSARWIAAAEAREARTNPRRVIANSMLPIDHPPTCD
jgi:hypothetical protein